MRLFLVTSCLSVLLGSLLVGLTALAQNPDTQPTMTQSKLPLQADLVLSQEFCATKKRQSLGDVLRVGKAACSQLEAELNGVFSGLRRVESVPAAGASTAHVVLIPRFVGINATKPLLGSSQRELVIFLEWTIQDAAGRTIWLQTVQG